MERKRHYLRGRYIVNLIRESLGFGEILCLVPLFRELKLQNPKIYTILSMADFRLSNMEIMMKGQPFPDKLIGISDKRKYQEYAEINRIAYCEINLNDVNYNYEQANRPDITKSRSRIYMEALGLQSNSKPFYRLLEEDLLWVDRLKLPPAFVLVQLRGAEPYKYCNKNMLKQYCQTIKNTYSECHRKKFDIVVVDSQEKVDWEGVISVNPPDIRKAMALVSNSIVTMGFDSFFQQATVALDIPYLGLLGPTSCPGRQADHKYAMFLRSHLECEPCFRESLSTCRITGERDVSACIYDIDLQQIANAIVDLTNRRATVLGCIGEYFPGQYYRDFDASKQPFNVQAPDMIKIHQPIHDDGSYAISTQQERVKWIIDHAITGENTLDIGCASGYIIDKMPKPTGSRNCGIDIDGDRIRAAKRLKSKDIDFYQINPIMGLPFQDNSFSTVILAEILEHVNFEEAHIILKEAYRVAKTKVLITMPYYDEAYKEDVERMKMVEDKDHLWLVSLGLIKKLLGGYNYTIEFTRFALIEIIK